MFRVTSRALAVLTCSLLLPATASAYFDRPLSLGATGADVQELQAFLMQAGFFVYPMTTQYFGPITAAALERYQASIGLEPVGVLGPRTRAHLNAQVTVAPTLASIIQELQELLRTHGYEHIMVTGVLDSATQDALTELGADDTPRRSNRSGGEGSSDSTAPVISGAATSTTASGATITWSTDDAADSRLSYGTTASYGTASTSSTLTNSHSITVTGLSADTTYHYQIASADAEGNIASTSDATFTTGSDADVTAPSVSITAPTNGATVSGDVSVTASASDAIGVVGVQFKLDGAPLESEDTSAPYAITWDSTGSANGSYALVAVARDAAGNYATSSTVTVTTSNAGGLLLTSLPTAPDARWSAAFSTVATSSGRVTSATDLASLADLTEGATGVGPYALTDGLNRPFWRFEGAEYANIETALTIDSRSVGVCALFRAHRSVNNNVLFGAGNVAAGTQVNTNGATFSIPATSSAAPTLRAYGTNSNADATNKAKMVVGSQLQLGCFFSRTTANGGTRFYLNTNTATGSQVTETVGVQGAEIGRFPNSPGSSGSWGMFDLYELAVFRGTITNSEADAIASAYVDNWNIPAVTNQLVLEGDSITQGVGTVTSSKNPAMVLTEPGSDTAMPGSYRVVNVGSSGATTATLLARRDATNSVYTMTLAGTNIMVGQVGRNDLPSRTGAAVYDDIVGLISTSTTGYLQRGWDVRWAVNVAVADSINAATADLRTLLRSSDFLTDTQTATGQTYAGLLSIIDLPLITSGASGTIFDTPADAADTDWYQGDNTHPTVTATEAMVTGADTPANGYFENVQ